MLVELHPCPLRNSFSIAQHDAEVPLWAAILVPKTRDTDSSSGQDIVLSGPLLAASCQGQPSKHVELTVQPLVAPRWPPWP